jgi:hypothetical protein
MTRDLTQLTLDNIILWGIVALVLFGWWCQFMANPGWMRIVKMLGGAGGCLYLIWRYWNTPSGSVPVWAVIAWLWLGSFMRSGMAGGAK